MIASGKIATTKGDLVIVTLSYRGSRKNKRTEEKTECKTKEIKK
jgi:hypothetical protein